MQCNSLFGVKKNVWCNALLHPVSLKQLYYLLSAWFHYYSKSMFASKIRLWLRMKLYFYFFKEWNTKDFKGYECSKPFWPHEQHIFSIGRAVLTQTLLLRMQFQRVQKVKVCFPTDVRDKFFKVIEWTQRL